MFDVNERGTRITPWKPAQLATRCYRVGEPHHAKDTPRGPAVSGLSKGEA